MSNALQQLMNIKPRFKEFEVEIEEGTVVKYKAKGLNGEEFEAYQKELIEFNNGERKFNSEKTIPALVFNTLHDMEGNRVFGKLDRALVDKLPYGILKEMFVPAAEMNGMATTEEEKVKNLEATQKD